MDKEFVELEQAASTWEIAQETQGMEHQWQADSEAVWTEDWNWTVEVGKRDTDGNSTQGSSMQGSPERGCGEWLLPLTDWPGLGLPRSFQVRKRHGRRYMTLKHAKRRTKQRGSAKYL